MAGKQAWRKRNRYRNGSLTLIANKGLAARPGAAICWPYLVRETP